MDIGPAELLIVLAIVLLLFGGTKLPSLARSLGQAAKEFRSGLSESTDDEEPEPPADSSTADDDVLGKSQPT
jgi:sec-independent protein translocase protein TatA